MTCHDLPQLQLIHVDPTWSRFPSETLSVLSICWLNRGRSAKFIESLPPLHLKKQRRSPLKKGWEREKVMTRWLVHTGSICLVQPTATAATVSFTDLFSLCIHSMMKSCPNGQLSCETISMIFSVSVKRMGLSVTIVYHEITGFSRFSLVKIAIFIHHFQTPRCQFGWHALIFQPFAKIA